MSLTVSPDEGFIPILSQILSLLCYSPVCFVSQGIKKGKPKDVHIALGIVRMIIGVLNIAVGFAFLCLGSWFTRIAQAPFWLGSVFLVVGIVCILATRFSNFCLVIIGMILNIVSAALAITAVVLYSVDLVNNNGEYCESYSSSYYSHYDHAYDYKAPSFEISRTQDTCQYYVIKMILGGLDIMMIVLSAFHICVTISFCVLTGKALCKKHEDVKVYCINSTTRTINPSNPLLSREIQITVPEQKKKEQCKTATDYSKP